MMTIAFNDIEVKLMIKESNLMQITKLFIYFTITSQNRTNLPQFDQVEYRPNGNLTWIKSRSFFWHK